jgi:uncharacterized repeat protein (TIGR01451 family)/fimbrial isopeptide formation D2 family protein
MTPALALEKTAVAGDPYNRVGDAVQYQYLVTNIGNVTINALSVTDDKIPSVQCPATTLASNARMTCTATHAITQADLDAGSVTNRATATGVPANGTLLPASASETVAATVTPGLALMKDVVAGDPYDAVGDLIDYTYEVTNTGNVTIDPLTVTDDRIATVQCPATSLAPNAHMTCTARYTIAQADLDAGSVTNHASAVGRAGSGTPISATDSATVGAMPRVTYSKSAGTSDPVSTGDVITYTLTVDIAHAPTTYPVTLTDTLGPGLRFRAMSDAGRFTCNAESPLICTLPAGTVPGHYTATYTATVEQQASRTVRNTVIATSDPSDTHPPTCDGTCTIETALREPIIVLNKSSNPDASTEVTVGQVIEYTLTLVVQHSATTNDIVLNDIPGPGLDLGALPAGCVAGAPGMVCTLPAGSPAGVHTFTYTATVNANAGASVGNEVLIRRPSDIGPSPICLNCEVQHHVAPADIRIAKTAAVREVRIGDLVRYTIAIDNPGASPWTNGSVVDTPPPGFVYVEGSLRVTDGDNQGAVEARHPLRFTGVDVAAGGHATLVYLLRVGANVRPGTQANRAQAFSSVTGEPISNVTTASVALAGDPLLDDSLVFGTVFDDRDGDGWQDSAELRDVRVQGGFAPDAYIAGSTTVDRGAGAQPEPDASAPLLHGIDVGAVAGDQRITIRQRLQAPTFTDDFVLTSAEGVTVRMDAAGHTRVETSDDAAHGLTAAQPIVERRVTPGEGGVVVDYLIRNEGIDEHGIPGVRIASLEGLLMETDQYGRYHLAGLSGGPVERGRNLLLKVDPSTLPAGSVFTTDNPLLRWITPGLPVRFDWGVQLPEALPAE